MDFYDATMSIAIAPKLNRVGDLLALTDVQKIRKWSDSDMTQQRAHCVSLRVNLARSGGVYRTSPASSFYGLTEGQIAKNVQLWPQYLVCQLTLKHKPSP